MDDRRSANRQDAGDRVNRIEDRIERLDAEVGKKLDFLVTAVIELKARLESSITAVGEMRQMIGQHEVRLLQFEREMILVRASGRGFWEVAKLVLGPLAGAGVAYFLLGGKLAP